MRSIAVGFFSKLLSEDQKKNRKQIATDLLECNKSDENVLKSIIKLPNLERTLEMK